MYLYQEILRCPHNTQSMSRYILTYVKIYISGLSYSKHMHLDLEMHPLYNFEIICIFRNYNKRSKQCMQAYPHLILISFHSISKCVCLKQSSQPHQPHTSNSKTTIYQHLPPLPRQQHYHSKHSPPPPHPSLKHCLTP